jgi:hypothetical protein
VIIRLCRHRCQPSRFLYYEFAVPDDALAKLWKRLKQPEEADWVGGRKVERRKKELYASAMFDHVVLRKGYKGIHRWLFRRWNAFNIATTSIWALWLSLPFGAFAGIPYSHGWFVPVLTFALVLVPAAVWAWDDTMNMAEFMIIQSENDGKGEAKGRELL